MSLYSSPEAQTPPPIPPVDPVAPAVLSLRGSSWKTRWIFIGLGTLIIFHGLAFACSHGFAPEAYRHPAILIGFGLALHAFLLAFPLLTRHREGRATIPWPRPRRLLVEFGIAIPCVIGLLLLALGFQFVLDRLMPGETANAEEMAGLARQPNRLLAYGILVFSFTVAPITEEIFFRGFLQNALRARMPFLAAIAVQSLIFGFSHFFGAIHSIATFIFALGFTAIYLWRKTLITPILVHAGNNLLFAIAVFAMMFAHDQRPFIGVQGGHNDTECIIRTVVTGSPASDAGLSPGDVILSINSEPVSNFTDLIPILSRYKNGDVVTLVFRRGDHDYQTNVKLSPRPKPSETETPPP